MSQVKFRCSKVSNVAPSLQNMRDRLRWQGFPHSRINLATLYNFDYFSIYSGSLCQRMNMTRLQRRIKDFGIRISKDEITSRIGQAAQRNNGLPFDKVFIISIYRKKNCAYPIDCSLKENLCCDTCNGSYVNGNYILPPGMFPLVCYPGKISDKNHQKFNIVIISNLY